MVKQYLRNQRKEIKRERKLAAVDHEDDNSDSDKGDEDDEDEPAPP